MVNHQLFFSHSIATNRKTMSPAKRDTENKILEAARKVFFRKGMEGARMQEIADEAGINKALLHYYFRSKEKLFRKIYSEAVEQFMPQVNTMLENPQIPLNEKIQIFVDMFIWLVYRNPFLPGFIIQELQRNPESFQQMMENHKVDTTPLQQQIEQEINMGNMRPITAGELIINLVSLCVLPIMIKPVLENQTEYNGEDEFKEVLEARKKSVVDFMLNALFKADS